MQNMVTIHPSRLRMGGGCSPRNYAESIYRDKVKMQVSTRYMCYKAHMLESHNTFLQIGKMN